MEHSFCECQDISLAADTHLGRPTASLEFLSFPFNSRFESDTLSQTMGASIPYSASKGTG